MEVEKSEDGRVTLIHTCPLLMAIAELMAIKPQVSTSSCSHMSSFKKKWVLLHLSPPSAVMPAVVHQHRERPMGCHRQRKLGDLLVTLQMRLLRPDCRT